MFVLGFLNIVVVVLISIVVHIRFRCVKVYLTFVEAGGYHCYCYCWMLLFFLMTLFWLYLLLQILPCSVVVNKGSVEAMEDYP